MQAYLDLIRRILDEGVRKDDRTGTGTISVFGHQMRFDLARAFRSSPRRSCTCGPSSMNCCGSCRATPISRYLKENGVSIWDEWADENGDLGPVYGKQWRSWAKPDGGTVDQIRWVLDEIRRNPDSPPPHRLAPGTRPISTGWRSRPAIACSSSTSREGRLSCQLYQRSADVFLGVPFNIASYALLTHMMAQATGLQPGDFVHSFGDAHLYLNHLEQARLQLSREPRPLPKLRLNPAVRSLFDFTFDDIAIEDYDPHPAIRAPVAV